MGLIIDPQNQYLYSLGIQSSIVKLARLNALDGVDKWTYDIPCVFESQDMSIKAFVGFHYLLVACNSTQSYL